MRRVFSRFIVIVAALYATTAVVRGADEIVLRLGGTSAQTAWLEQVELAYRGVRPGTTAVVENMAADRLIPRLLTGSVDAVLMPRPVTENELGLARIAKKPDLRSYPVALGAVLVVVNRSSPIESITINQVGKLLTQSLVTWQQLDVPTEGTPLAMPKNQRRGDGHEEEVPAPISVFVPSPAWGTDEWLRRRTLGLAEISQHLRRVDSSAEVIEFVSQDVRALGFVGLPVPEGVKALPVRDVEGRFTMTREADPMSAREYPLACYTYVVTSGAPTDPVRDLIAYLVSVEGQLSIAAHHGILSLPTNQSTRMAPDSVK